MEVVLNKKACMLFDAGVSSKFEHLNILPRESGVYIQALDKSRTIVVEHYIDKMLFKGYTGKSGCLTIPYTKTYIQGMDTLRICTAGALVKMSWSGAGVVLEKNVYLVDGKYYEVEYSPSFINFSLPFSIFALAARLADGPVDVRVQGSCVEIKGLGKTKVLLRVQASLAADVSCRFVLLKYHLDRIPRALYDTASFGVDKRGMISLSLEALGMVTTISVSTEVEV